MINSLAIFCGSSPGNDPVYADSAKKISKLLCNKNIDIIYGGGRVGLMGIVADEAILHDGKVIGVIPEKLRDMEVGHDGITELHVVATMHDRKAMMAQLSDGFIALPGGIGTLEEIIEVFTWHQIGYHNKPCAFLNTNGYYDRLLSMIHHMVQEGFLPQSQKDELIVDENPTLLLQKMEEASKN